MANELQELLNEISDPRLKKRLTVAFEELRKSKKFGLVFEEHLPELLPIHSAKIQRHARVARKLGRLTETFIVDRVVKGIATVRPERGSGDPQNFPAAELVVVKRFGEAIFPALRHVESLLRGTGAPHHTLIEADNYHALQLLEWLYAEKVDCIYIDPPYNTGARTWKYNNDYVDVNDSYRHSKWLAMMKRRLLLAMRLLKQSGILVITIDDYEMHRLVMLLDDLPFSSEVLGVVPIKNNPAGRSTVRGFAVAHEYAVGLVFRREGEHCIVDLLEPHDPGLSDSLSKAHGLCNFAENYGDRFGRIEWIKCEGSQIKRLNLNSFKVRSEVLKTTVDGAINNLFDAFGTTESRVAVP